MKIEEIKARSLISPSKIPGIDFVINPYFGCLHGCLYCYARFLLKFKEENLIWGKFCQIKINAPELLEKEIKKIPWGAKILLSSVTDCYNPLEKIYGLTRKILEIFQKADRSDLSLEILTKSDLILRDLDLLKKIKNLEVGLTITSLKETDQKLLEPGASSPQKRLKALKKLKEEGLKTYAFLAPLLLGFLDLEEVFQALVGKVDYLLVDILNVKGENWFNLERVLKNFYPELLKKYQAIYFQPVNFLSYQKNLKEKLKILSKKYKLPVEFAF